MIYRKHIVVLVLIVFYKYHFICAATQAIVKTGYSEQGYYLRFVEKHKKTEHDIPDIVIVGDSILYGLKLLNIDGCVIDNLSIPGEISRSLYKRTPHLKYGETTDIVMMIGVNDIGQNVAPYKIVQNIAGITRYFLPDVNSVTLLTVIETDGFVRNNANIRHLNRLIFQYFSHSEKVSIVDINRELNNRFSSPCSYTYDGIHLSPEANQVMRTTLTQHLSANSTCAR